MCGCLEDAEGIGIRQSWIPWWFIKQHSNPGATLSPWQHSPWQYGLVGFCIFYIPKKSLKPCAVSFVQFYIVETGLQTLKLFYLKKRYKLIFWSQMFHRLKTCIIVLAKTYAVKACVLFCCAFPPFIQDLCCTQTGALLNILVFVQNIILISHFYLCFSGCILLYLV